ncbi:DUF4176 domain-containing protein [Streptococcus sp. KHUD_018]|jgi:hypothetical protein
MSNYLTIGSVVQLQNGNTKVMIINRFPLHNNRGTIGYFDYSACLYPSGNTDNQVYFFNHGNIDKIWFEGYIDEAEEQLQEKYIVEKKNISYPRLTLEL